MPEPTGLYAHFYDSRHGDRHAVRGPFPFVQLTYALLRAAEDAEVAAFEHGLWLLTPDDGRRGYTDVVVSEDPTGGFPPGPPQEP